MKKLLCILSFSILLLSFEYCFGQWQQTSLNSYQIESLATNGTNIFAGTYNGEVFLSTNNGTDWKLANNGLPNQYSITTIAINGTNIFAGTGSYSEGGIYLSTNNGETWTAVNNGLPYSGGYPYVSSLAISGTNIFAGTCQYGVFLSTDNGGSWIAKNNGLCIDYNHCIGSLAMSGTNIFASAGCNGYPDMVYLSTNNGVNWKLAGDSTSSAANYVYALTTNGTNIFAGTEKGVYLSTNNGGNWNVINNGFSGGASILVINGTNIFAGNSGAKGIFLSTNNGSSWKTINNGFADSTNVQKLVVNGSYVFAGTNNGNSGGVWKRSLSEITGVNELRNGNGELRIKVYPNPANSLLVVSYSLLEKTKIDISICDVTGRKVDIIENGELRIENEGEHTINFNTEGLKSGVYFVRLISNDGVGVTKFVKK